jgi:radical SAM protein with 4Fe4S-binding SPASM domain
MTASLDIEVTRKCNLRCDYCFVGWSRDWTSNMPPAIAYQIVREGAGLFPVLHFTGGEAFAYRALFDLVEAGLELDYREILINTNGTLLTPAIAARLAGYGARLHISVSLDGPQPTHDAVRGAGMYERASQGIDFLLAAGVRVTVMSVVTPAVLPALPDFVPQLFSYHPGIVGVTLFPVGVGPEGSQKPGAKLSPLTPGELRELALAVALLYRAGYSVGVAAYPIINPLLTAYGYPTSKLYQCTAGRGRVCVHADLSVSTCHPVKDPVYGTWQPGLLRRLHEFPAHQRMATRDFDGCRTCKLQEACGHCRAFVTGAGQPLYGNDRICHEALRPIIELVPVVRTPAGGYLTEGAI